MASYALGNIYKTRREKPKDLKIALECFKKAARQTDSLSQLLAQAQIYKIKKEMKSKKYIQSKIVKFIMQEQRRKENEKKKQEEIDLIRKKNIKQKQNQPESKELPIQPLSFQTSTQEEKREILKHNQNAERKKQDKEDKKRTKSTKMPLRFLKYRFRTVCPIIQILKRRKIFKSCPPSALMI